MLKENNKLEVNDIVKMTMTNHYGPIIAIKDNIVGEKLYQVQWKTTDQQTYTTREALLLVAKAYGKHLVN